MLNNITEILNEIRSQRSIALLAPAFPIDFQYPSIIGMLRHLGFDKVTELTYGARMVNWHYGEYIKNHPNQKLFIASPAQICSHHRKSISTISRVFSSYCFSGDSNRKDLSQAPSRSQDYFHISLQHKAKHRGSKISGMH